jgi:hypothetical protein
MASVAQVLANRSNAQKSTGPRTPEGKAAVAQNAVQHGLLARQVVIKGEDPGEFELFRDRMLWELDPAGAVQTLLAERIVNLSWRLRRAEGLESAAFGVLEANQIAQAMTRPAAQVPAGGVTPAEAGEESVLGQVVVQDFGDAKVLDRLLGYERRIENSLYRTMGELRKEKVVREVEVSSLKCEASGKQSHWSSPSTSEPALPTSDEPACAEGIEEVGRGRPTYEETPDGVTTNGAETDGRSGETKPNAVLWCAGHTRNNAQEDGVHSTPYATSDETKPIGRPEDASHAIPFSQA